ncbi:MAG: DUF5667 domain-containing protein [Chloroflexi bacterium]|nr:DUF5667 domain-containing protein [Chloroflexota bacterium]
MKHKLNTGELTSKLAAPRELTQAERALAEAEPALRERLSRYEAQDELLAALPQPRVSADTIGRILSATTQAPAHKQPRFSRRRLGWSALAIGLALVIMLSSTGYAAAQSLPGDTLYAVKRGYEQVRLGLTFNQEQKAAYQQSLWLTRQAEAQRVLQLGRQGVQVELEGVLEQDASGQWSVSGVPVTLDAGADWAPGMHVQLHGAVEGNRIRVREVQPNGDPNAVVTPQGDTHRYGQTPAAATAQAGGTPEANEAESTSSPSGEQSGSGNPRKGQINGPKSGGPNN